jgi:hypothetical protein
MKIYESMTDCVVSNAEDCLETAISLVCDSNPLKEYGYRAWPQSRSELATSPIVAALFDKLLAAAMRDAEIEEPSVTTKKE